MCWPLSATVGLYYSTLINATKLNRKMASIEHCINHSPPNYRGTNKVAYVFVCVCDYVCEVGVYSPCIPLGRAMEPDTRKLKSLSVWTPVGQWTTQLDPTELIGSEQITKQNFDYSQGPIGRSMGK